jgi:hypothetical protein
LRNGVAWRRAGFSRDVEANAASKPSVSNERATPDGVFLLFRDVEANNVVYFAFFPLKCKIREDGR